MVKKTSKKNKKTTEATRNKSSNKKASIRKKSHKTSSTNSVSISWLSQPFEVFGDRLNDLVETYELSVSGISLLKRRPDALKELKKHVKNVDFVDLSALDKASLGSWADQFAKCIEIDLNLHYAEEEAGKAKTLLSKGLPIIHYQTLVSLWGLFESFVHILLSSILLNDIKSKEISEVKKVKVPLADFESLDAQERSYYIIEAIEHHSNVSHQKGVGRFESLLKMFGLGGALEEASRQYILGLQQIRHVIVHRNGFVDKKLCVACPWLKLKIGSKIDITREDLKNYIGAVQEYVIEISRRVISKYSASRTGKHGAVP